MITIRRSNERGHADHGWLKSYHSFSFANYIDREYVGYKTLRVINEDFIAASQGFGTHPHRDMEIFTWVLKGRLAHKDSTGSESTIGPGDVQVMSAGTGVLHSEFNASATEEVHLMQMWIHPREKGIKPRYAERNFPVTERKNLLRLILSPEEESGSLLINQDAWIYTSLMDAGINLAHEPRTGDGWIQVASGEITINGETLKAGDGASFKGEKRLDIEASKDSEILLFDL